METVLIILSSLFGGLNIFQFIFFRVERRKRNAEADLAVVDVKKVDIDLQQDQFNFLSEQLTKYLKEYYALDEQMRIITKDYSKIINQKCNEIIDLQARLATISVYKCYDKSCLLRQKDKKVTLNDKEDEKN